MLWILIALLLLLAVGFIGVASRSLKIVLLLSAAVLVSSTLMYHFLGNSQGLHNAALLQIFDTRSAQGQDNQPVLRELIVGLNQQLEKHPQDPMAWALLGRIHLTLKEYTKATNSFAKAYALMPDDPEILIDYATADFLAQNGVVNPSLAFLLLTVEKLEPSLESLSLLANVALSQGDTHKAILYWQAMLTLAPANSALYQELLLTIEQAKQQ